MARGKQTCKILKEIRRQIAEANDIEFITSIREIVWVLAPNAKLKFDIWSNNLNENAV